MTRIREILTKALVKSDMDFGSDYIIKIRENIIEAIQDNVEMRMDISYGFGDAYFRTSQNRPCDLTRKGNHMETKSGFDYHDEIDAMVDHVVMSIICGLLHGTPEHFVMEVNTDNGEWTWFDAAAESKEQL